MAEQKIAEPNKPAAPSDIKVDLPKPEPQPAPAPNPAKTEAPAAENVPGDDIADMEKQLEEQYAKDPAPPPKATEIPLTGIQKFDLGIKIYNLALAACYVL